MTLENRIKQQAISLGFHLVGIASVETPTSDASDRLRTWLALGFHANMQWMGDQRRQDITAYQPDAKSVICVALNYYTPHSHSQHPQDAKISRYGWGRDYHKVMRKKLKALTYWLESQQENVTARYFADTAPVQDKVWAEKAGIGWIAKNGNVISREYGSWIFLGGMITNLALVPDQPHTSHCGSCTRCLDACPTAAITQPYVIDANRCIAYHTIENRAEKLPEQIASQLQGWVAGCDICQDVCPWNQRFAKETNIRDFQPYAKNIKPKLQELAEISYEEWNNRFPASALRRIKPEMMRRNARANLEYRPAGSL